MELRFGRCKDSLYIDFILIHVYSIEDASDCGFTHPILVIFDQFFAQHHLAHFLEAADLEAMPFTKFFPYQVFYVLYIFGDRVVWIYVLRESIPQVNQVKA